jgi:hypothetical protein
MWYSIYPIPRLVKKKKKKELWEGRSLAFLIGPPPDKASLLVIPSVKKIKQLKNFILDKCFPAYSSFKGNAKLMRKVGCEDTVMRPLLNHVWEINEKLRIST